ncbi:hypothetical protein BKD09_17755 [Bradyrhizobium japonicum]|uniref:DNA-binding protein n=1 Tax=Bradyrhizobium japonicum TaxID=375 RepID=A0A1L3FA32_BRAJP|nr:hypothetical protein [Bradyrhizobium japonicum]APG10176.1 hypothetical protein BKD09_17755 [Bradyrhizobium japonicum]
MTDREIQKAIRERLTVPLWPHAGRALNLKRGATYAAAAAGKIPTLNVSRKKDVPCSWLRNKLGLKQPT